MLNKVIESTIFELLSDRDVMYQNLFSFGFNVLSHSIGEAWLDLVDLVILNGEKCFDEERARHAISNIRIKVTQHSFPDALLTSYGHPEKIQKMLDFTFRDEEIHDIDHSPSFTVPAKSYFQRIQEGNMVHFVVERLALIPESKKAVITFPTYEDYRLILENQRNDYLPCLVLVHFRLVQNSGEHFTLNTNFYSRSMDVFQKGQGNLAMVAVLSQNVADQLSVKMQKKISLGFIDGFIADAHIYDDTLGEAKERVQQFKFSQDVV